MSERIYSSLRIAGKMLMSMCDRDNKTLYTGVSAQNLDRVRSWEKFRFKMVVIFNIQRTIWLERFVISLCQLHQTKS